MEITPLSKQAQATLGANEEWKITPSDLTETTADTDQTLTVAVDAGDLISVVCHSLKVPFEDASDAAFNSTLISIGDGGDPDRLMAATQINENGTEVLYGSGTGTSYAYLVADTVDILIESMAAKSLSNIDTGDLRIYVKRAKLADMNS